MNRLFRPGRWAAAISAFVTLLTPVQTSAQSRIQQSFATTAPVAARSEVVQPIAAAPIQAYTYPQATVAQQPALAPVRRSLSELVAAFVNRGGQDQEQLCLAKAVYFEARGESLEGQLAVAEVVLNRAASGRYPATLCGVVTQPWQFSFIRQGRFPSVNAASPAWHRALAIADIARNRLAAQVPSNVLWYHANYVAPSWGRRLTRVTQIGAHIFYG